MTRPDLERLSETLLRGGIAPRHVRRYMAELRDHADDLVGAGASVEGAWARLGSEDHLAAHMLSRAELKSWGARHPAVYFGLGPLAMLLTAFVVSLFAVAGLIITSQYIHGVSSSTELTQESLDALSALQPALGIVFWVVKYIVPVVLGLIFALQALRQRVAVRWAVMGLALIAVVGGASDISVTWPTLAGQKGELKFGFGWFPSFPDLGNSFFRALVNAAFVAPVLAWLHHLRAKPLR